MAILNTSGLFVLSILAGVAMSSTDNATTIRTPVTDKIVGGRDALHVEYPYIASIVSQNPIAYCSGAILSSTKVVTTAGCCRALGDFRNWSIATGFDDLWNISSTLFIQVKLARRIIIHSSYSGNSQMGWTNDACSIILSSPLRFDTHTQSIPLCNSEPSVGGSCTMVGWGSTSSSEVQLPKALQKLDMQVISRTDCKSRLASNLRNAVEISNFCTQPISGTQNCVLSYGDEGNPLFCRENGVQCLAGISSWHVLPCGQYPYVFNNGAYLSSFYNRNA